MRRTLVALLLLLIAPLSGCASGPEESTPTPTTAPTPTTWGPTEGFVVESLRIENALDPERAVREDDAAMIRYGLRNPADNGSAVTRFVTFVVDGEIVSVDPISLAPGQTESFEHAYGAVRGRERVSAEVRVAPGVTKAELEVRAWPRTGETVALGNVSLRVNRWLANETTGGIDVNATVSRPFDPAATIAELRVSTLCVDASDNVTRHGEARPTVPAPGESRTQDIRLPGCPDTLYGIRVKGLDNGVEFEHRILFVERGWRPSPPA